MNSSAVALYGVSDNQRSPVEIREFLMETLAFPDRLAARTPDGERQNLFSGPKILPQNLDKTAGRGTNVSAAQEIRFC